jgi:glucose/arabinose dehydrogenase
MDRVPPPRRIVTCAHRLSSRAAYLVAAAWLATGCGGSDGNGDGGGGGPPPVVDTTPPSVPQGLVATAQSSSEVLLEWQPSTDAGAGVAGYRIYRNDGAEPVATVTSGTTHTDTNLMASTPYTYAVQAFDAASPANVSAASAVASVTTLAGGDPPTQVSLAVERVFGDLPLFTAPVAALQAPGNGSSWYIVEQQGRVLAFDATAGVAATRTVLDLRDRVTAGGERGLLGMAFHPAFPTNPRVYLSYTTTVAGALVSHVSEFLTNDGGATFDAASERVLLRVEQPDTNHNGGHVAFGPEDGLLYVGFGDGGDGGDPWGAIGNGQDLQTLLGKMLRIDVDGTSATAPYRVPPDNPYAGNATCAEGGGAQPCPEIHAYGFRNPWRWSFDRATGELWVADVGQSAREEVDRVVAGGNYGWRCFEGTLVYNPVCGPNAGLSLPPVLEYARDAGQAITGGYVYRGTAIPPLVGRYVFGDFGSGRLWHEPRGVEPTPLVQAADGVNTGLRIVSFAEAIDGELYVLDYGGALYRIVAEPR